MKRTLAILSPVCEKNYMKSNIIISVQTEVKLEGVKKIAE